MSAFTRIAFFGLLVCLLYISVGCADSEAPACNVSPDCEGTDICVDGYCEVLGSAECSLDSECPDLHSCVASQCVADDNNQENQNQENQNQENQNQENQNQENQNQENQNQDNQNQENQNQDNQEIDPNSPQVESITPSAGTSGVSVDTEIRIRFDRPIADDMGSLTDAGVYLQTPDGSKVPADLTYLPDEREVILQPVQPLRQGTRYVLNVTSFIRDVTRTYALSPEVESAFVTDYTIHPDLQAASELFAPVIFQETRATNGTEIHSDIPTRVDFDGDLDADNNMANSLLASASLPANVYYSAVSTETHYFVHYILYYPSRRQQGMALYEHDFTGYVVAINRDTLNLELVEGVYARFSSAETGSATFKPASSPVEERNENHQIVDFPDAQLIAGSHFPLYVPSGEHAGCFWHERTSGFFPTPCDGNDGEFIGGEGIVMRPGDQAQTHDQAVVGESGYPEITYTLTPFVEPFWTERGDYGCGLYASLGFLYDPWSPQGHTPLTGPGTDTLYLPRRLCTSSSEHYGVMPFQWFSADSSGGEWFLDPAMALAARFEFPDGFSRTYCDNIYFGIDRNQEPECSN